MKQELRIRELSDDEMDREFGVMGTRAEFLAGSPMRDTECYL